MKDKKCGCNGCFHRIADGLRCYWHGSRGRGPFYAMSFIYGGEVRSTTVCATCNPLIPVPVYKCTLCRAPNKSYPVIRGVDAPKHDMGIYHCGGCA